MDLLIFIAFFQHYYILLISGLFCLYFSAEACNVSSGFGFNGYDDRGHAKWNQLDNAIVLKVEVNVKVRDHADLNIYLHVLEYIIQVPGNVLELMAALLHVLESVISSLLHFTLVLAIRTADDFIVFYACELFLINLP